MIHVCRFPVTAEFFIENVCLPDNGITKVDRGIAALGHVYLEEL